MSTPIEACWDDDARHRVIRDPARLPSLAIEWAMLWQRSDASPFQHPAWLLPWWDQFGTGAPRLVLLRDRKGMLLGLLPLYDLMTAQKTLPMGVGLSDYCGAVLAADAPAHAADRLLQAGLVDSGWPCHLPDLPLGAALRQVAPPPGWTLTTCAGETCPVLQPPDVPARQRRKLRMARHRAARIGGYALVAGDTPAALFSDLTQLHAQAWADRGEPGVLADARVQTFHATALPLLDRAGLLHLRALRFGEKTVAVIYALSAPGRLYLYLSGFDPTHRFESPGTILIGAILDEAMADGVGEVHFLRGAETYKYAWGATDRHNATLLLEPA